METYQGNLAQPLIDDELWGPVFAALERAQREVLLTQLLFETAYAPAGRRVDEAIEDASKRGAAVRILVNENAAIPDSYDELVARFEGTTVEVRALHMTPNVLHTKVLVVDAQEAFLLDSPFETKYGDTRTHPFDVAWRKHAKPHHSVSLRLRGPCVAGVRDGFDALWRAARGEALPPAPPPAPAGPQTLRLAWTNPPNVMRPEARHDVLAEYAKAIARAERFVYLENQYFTSPEMRRILADALERQPKLEVILAVNVHMDVPGYDGWQAVRLRELGWPDHPRLGVFAIWSPRRTHRVALREVYLHSKLGIVDDAWATIGSANLDSISLHEATEFGAPFPENVELNAVLLDGIEGAPGTGLVAALRRRVWGEHLGDHGIWRADPPAEGWLAKWRAIAQRNAERFEAHEHDLTGRALPFGALPTTWRQRLFSRDEPRP